MVADREDQDRRRRVVISTHTIALQEQLIQKDIPLLNAVLPEEFTAVLVKGRGNYLSLRRAQRAWERSATLYDTGAPSGPIPTRTLSRDSARRVSTALSNGKCVARDPDALRPEELAIIWPAGCLFPARLLTEGGATLGVTKSTSA